MNIIDVIKRTKIYGKFQDRQFLLDGFRMSDLFRPLYIIRHIIYQQTKIFADSVDGGRLLDFGCGEKPYQNMFVVDEYIGIDIEDSGHCNEKKKADIYWDGKKIPFIDDYFENIICSQVMEHTYNYIDILKELYRVLKPNGRIMISVPFLWNLHEVPYDFFRYTEYSLKNILVEVGFREVNITKLGSNADALRQLRILCKEEELIKRPSLISMILYLGSVFRNNLVSVIDTKDDSGTLPLQYLCICRK